MCHFPDYLLLLLKLSAVLPVGMDETNTYLINSQDNTKN